MKSRNIILAGLAILVVAGLVLSNLPPPQPEAWGAAANAPAAAQPAPAQQPAPAAADPHPDHSPTAADLNRVPHYFKTIEEAGTLPKVLPASHFYIPVVQRAYTAAAKIPKVLALQPCYCWCDKIGHGSLLDCFATDHGAG